MGCDVAGKSTKEAAEEIKKELSKVLNTIDQEFGTGTAWDSAKYFTKNTVWNQVRQGLLADVMARLGEFFSSIIKFERRNISSAVAHLSQGNVDEFTKSILHVTVAQSWKEAYQRLFTKGFSKTWKQNVKDKGLFVTISDFLQEARVIQKNRYDILDSQGDNPLAWNKMFDDKAQSIIKQSVSKLGKGLNDWIDGKGGVENVVNNFTEFSQIIQRHIPMLTDAIVENGAINTLVARQSAITKDVLRKESKRLGMSIDQADQISEVFTEYLHTTVTRSMPEDKLAKQMVKKLGKIMNQGNNKNEPLMHNIATLFSDGLNETIDEISSLTFKNDLTSPNRAWFVQFIGRLDRVLREQPYVGFNFIGAFLRTGTNLTASGAEILLPANSLKKLKLSSSNFEKVEALTEITIAGYAWTQAKNAWDSNLLVWDSDKKTSYVYIDGKEVDVTRVHPLLKDAMDYAAIAFHSMEEVQFMRENLKVLASQGQIDLEGNPLYKEMSDIETAISTIVTTAGEWFGKVYDRYGRTSQNLAFAKDDPIGTAGVMLSQLAWNPWDGFMHTLEQFSHADGYEEDEIHEEFKQYLSVSDAINGRYWTLRKVLETTGMIEPFERQIDVTGKILKGKRTFVGGKEVHTGDEEFQKFARTYNFRLKPVVRRSLVMTYYPAGVELPRDHMRKVGEYLDKGKTVRGVKYNYTYRMNRLVEILREKGVTNPIEVRRQMLRLHNKLYDAAHKTVAKELEKKVKKSDGVLLKNAYNMEY